MIPSPNFRFKEGEFIVDEQTNVGEKIRTLRKQLKLTQAELAGNDFTKSFISQIEKGQTNPSLKSLRVIAGRLGIPVSYLMTDSDTSETPGECLVLIQNARNHESQQDYGEAIQLYHQALKGCSKSDHAMIGYIHSAIGEVFHRQDLIDKAIESIELAVEHLAMSHDLFNYVRTCNLLGHILSESKRVSEANEMFQKAFDAIKVQELDGNHLKLRTLVNLGITYSRLGKYQLSVNTLEEALELMRSDDNFYSYGRVCHALGFAYAQQNQILKAIVYTEKAINLYEAVQNNELAWYARINMAIFLRKNGEVSKATEQLTVVQNTSDLPSDIEARTHAELAHLAIDQKNVQEALDHLATALEISPQHVDMAEWAEILVDCAKLGDIPDSLVQSFEDAAANWSGASRDLADVHSSLGELYSQRGDPTRANRHLSKSIELYKSSRNV